MVICNIIEEVLLYSHMTVRVEHWCVRWSLRSDQVKELNSAKRYLVLMKYFGLGLFISDVPPVLSYGCSKTKQRFTSAKECDR